MEFETYRLVLTHNMHIDDNKVELDKPLIINCTVMTGQAYPEIYYIDRMFYEMKKEVERRNE